MIDQFKLLCNRLVVEVHRSFVHKRTFTHDQEPKTKAPQFALQKCIALGFWLAIGFRNKPKRTIFDLWCSDPWTSEQVIVANVGELRAISHVHRKSDQVEADGMIEEQATTKARETDRRERRQGGLGGCDGD